MDDITANLEKLINFRIGYLVVLLLSLEGCGTMTAMRDNFRQDSGPLQPVDIASIPDAIPKVEPLSKYGNPTSYVVDGERYYVMASSSGYVKRGIASWYGTKFHGQRTSSGEPYDMYAMTAAHKTLPLPTYAEVTNLLNGRTVIVKINDRGPFKDNREIDLSYAAAAKLGITETGTGIIELKAINPATYHQHPVSGEYMASVDDHPPSLFLQIGAFAERLNAERLISRLSSDAPAGVHFSIDRDVKTLLYRVRVGPISNVDEADRMSADLALLGISDSHIVVN
jgi:peptidoglycan lytic transglycosylase